jgi:hypothetical protein
MPGPVVGLSFPPLAFTGPGLPLETEASMNDNNYFLKLSMEHLAEVKEAINFHADTIKMLEESLAADERMMKIAELRGEIKSLEQKANNIRTEIEPEAVKLYEETGEKSLLPGLGIRVYTELEYEEETALQHCISKDMLGALRVDKKSFEKYAKAMADVDPLNFVRIIEVPKPTIATDLSEYLMGEKS